MSDNDRRSTSYGPERHKPQRTTSAAGAVAILVAKTLGHYWTADDSEAARTAQITDWIEDLVEFGPTIVNEAFREWRHTENRRPTIAQIRSRCIALQREPREHALRLEDHRAPWPRWLAEIWGEGGQLERRDAIALQEARYLRGEFFRGQPPDVVAEGSLEQLRQRWPEKPAEVVSRAYDLICETMDKRRERFHQAKAAE